MLLPIERVKRFFDGVTLPSPLDEATEMLLDELRARLPDECLQTDPDVVAAFLLAARSSSPPTSSGVLRSCGMYIPSANGSAGIPTIWSTRISSAPSP